MRSNQQKEVPRSLERAEIEIGGRLSVKAKWNKRISYGKLANFWSPAKKSNRSLLSVFPRRRLFPLFLFSLFSPPVFFLFNLSVHHSHRPPVCIPCFPFNLWMKEDNSKLTLHVTFQWFLHRERFLQSMNLATTRENHVHMCRLCWKNVLTSKSKILYQIALDLNETWVLEFLQVDVSQKSNIWYYWDTCSIKWKNRKLQQIGRYARLGD